MLKIRRNTFETNSSSMHSLVLKSSNSDTPNEDVERHFIKRLIDVNGKLYLPVEGESFEHGFSIVSDPYEKFLYLIAGCRKIRDIRVVRDALKLRFEKIDKKVANAFTGFIFKNEDNYGYSNKKTKRTNNDLNPVTAQEYEVFFQTGDIDHQSASLPADAIHSVNTDSVKSAEEIIFSSKFFFVIESDGDDPFIIRSIKDGIYDISMFKAILETFYPTHLEKDSTGTKMVRRTDYEHEFPYWKNIEDVIDDEDDDD